MDTSRSSSSSSQHYSVLLQTVSELRTDLEKTMTKIKSLEDQNQNLTNNYQVVKDELIQTRFKYNETKESYLNAVAEKFEAERQHEAFMERLKVQLSEKTQEFELIRDKLIPHDIDQLRIKVQEELEVQHKAQLQVLENQLEQERNQHFTTKRNYERGKVEYEVLIQHQQQEIQTLRNDHEEIESDLRERIMKLKELEVTQPLRDEKTKFNRGQVSELLHTIEILREEIKNMKATNDENIYLIEHNKSNHEQAIIHLKTRLSTIETEYSGSEENKSYLTIENERKDGLLRTYRTNIDDLTTRLEIALKQLSENEKKSQNIRDENQKYIENLQKTLENERIEHQDRLDHLSERVIEKEEALRRTVRDMTESKGRNETAVSEMRRSHQLELQEARRKYAAVSILLLLLLLLLLEYVML